MTDDTDDHDTDDEKRKVKDISHTHPHHDEPFGATGTYDRGEEETVEEDEDVEEGTAEDDPDRDDDRRADGGSGRRTVADIDHTPPGDVTAQGAYVRGPEDRSL